MKSPFLLGIVIGSQGLLALTGGVWAFYQSSLFRAGAEHAQGTVIANHLENEDSGNFYHPEVQFSTPDGKTHKFISKSGAMTAAFKVGDRVPLIYEADEPESARFDTFHESYFAAVLLTSIGAVMTIGGGIPLCLLIRRKRIAAGLKTTGRRVEAVVGSVKHNPYRITAQWTDPSTNRIYQFQSEEVGFNPSPYLPASDMIDVLIDPKNPKRYWIDTTFLPKAQ